MKDLIFNVSIIWNIPELLTEFQKSYKINEDTLIDSIQAGIVAPEVLSKIRALAPICYSIGDNVFLKGEEKSGFDYVGDEMGESYAIELYDMTTEMTTGDSYSWYVSTTDYLPFASLEQHRKVYKFLQYLKHGEQ